MFIEKIINKKKIPIINVNMDFFMFNERKQNKFYIYYLSSDSPWSPSVEDGVAILTDFLAFPHSTKPWLALSPKGIIFPLENNDLD